MPVCFDVCAPRGSKAVCPYCSKCHHICKGHPERLARQLPPAVKTEIERRAQNESLVDRRKPR